MTFLFIRYVTLLASCILGSALVAGETHEYDIVVYGGSPAGITASVQAARMGHRVVLIEPTRHLGGLATSGGSTGDAGLAHTTGGIAREFHERLWAWYAQDSRWIWEKRAKFSESAPTALEPESKRMWSGEPHVVGRIFDDLLRESKVHVVAGQPLNPTGGVKMDANRIISITVRQGDIYTGKVFLDATYEGDLMAAAGVTCRTGREANSTYHETLNGVRPPAATGSWAKWKLDAKREAGKDGPFPFAGVASEPPGEPGSATAGLGIASLQLCVTSLPANRLAWVRPASHDAANYELAVLVAQKLEPTSVAQFLPMPNSRARLVLAPELTALLSDLEPAFLDGDPQSRRRITRQQRDQFMGLIWTLAHDERVPEATRKLLQDQGPCRDEWSENGGIPPQLSLCGVRRMVSDVVMAEKHFLGDENFDDSVGLSSGSLKLGAMSPWVSTDGIVVSEAVVHEDRAPQPVSFRSLFPKPTECVNLLVPVCLSASHVGHSSLAGESVFMVLGQSAGTAAALAIEGKVDVAALDYHLLRTRLLADGQVLEDDHLRREVRLKINKEKAAADSVLSDLERKTQERAKARAANQEKRRQEEGSR